MKIKNGLAGIITLLTLLFTTFSYAADENEVDKHGVILNGYDTVAYFTENAAVKGSDEFTAKYNEATYQFSSAENRDLFEADPEKYAPKYGGFCAYALTFGKKVPVNGKAFEVVDDKLYVNKSKGVYNTWLEDRDENIAKADMEWPEIEHTAKKDL